MSKLKKSALIAAALTVCLTANAFYGADKAFALSAPVMPTENAQAIRSESDTDDVFSILPKTIAEYNQFIEKYGNVSVHEKYIIYCDKIDYSNGFEVIMEQLGTAEVKKVNEYSIETDEPLRPGSPNNVVYVYEAVAPGTVIVTISQGRPWEPETSKEVKDESNYEVTENLTIKKIAEIITNTVKGDINGDGKLSVADVIILQQWLVKKTDITPENADINKDGTLNIFDLILLKRMLIDES